MKVLHILHELKFSGAEIMYVDAAPIFLEEGYELTVMATAEKTGEYAPFFKKAGYGILHKPIPNLKQCFRRIKFYVELIKLLKKEQYKVVHIHSHPIMWGMAVCAWFANVTAVYTFHNVFPTRFITYPYHCLIRWSAKTIFKCRFQTISDAVYDHELNFYHNKTTKIYNWYANLRFSPASMEEKEAARKNLKIDKDAFVIISVGGCSSIKNHADIIQSLPIILKEIPSCLYLHLGSGKSEVEEMKLAKQLGIENSVKFCGNQTDLRKFLIASDVYLMTSRFEGISLTTIEAMACRIPAILYDVPGLRDFNKYGQHSILIPEDYRLLAEKVVYIQNNTKSSEEMTIKAKEFVNTYFNININVHKIMELYNYN